MILVDYSQIVLANLFARAGGMLTEDDIDENVVRYLILDSIRNVRNKFKAEYGEMILCVDGGRSWRKDIFPYYKAKRAESREESAINWKDLYSAINTVSDELDEVFKYPMIRVASAEADDIIATITHKHGVYLGEGEEKIHIWSSDKDFIQLHKYSNVSQYSSMQGSVLHSDPEDYLIEHILKGDKGDGVPNVLSSDNCIVIGERQTTMTKKRLEILKQAYVTGVYPEEFKNVEEKVARNSMLIDLEKIPDFIQQKIHDEYEIQIGKDRKRKRLFNYFFDRGLKNLMEHIGDF